jgi:predicted nucleic acid-binding protein
MGDSFFDTNVILYIASNDPAKADRAEALIGVGGAISVQVLNEFTHVARRKMRLTWRETLDLLSTMRRLLTVHPLTVDVHDVGLSVARRHNFSLYDAMIVACALEAGCETLWSEDMHHGMVIDGRLRIANPFRAESPPSRPASGR